MAVTKRARDYHDPPEIDGTAAQTRSVLISLEQFSELIRLLGGYMPAPGLSIKLYVGDGSRSPSQVCVIVDPGDFAVTQRVLQIAADPGEYLSFIDRSTDDRDDVFDVTEVF